MTMPVPCWRANRACGQNGAGASHLTCSRSLFFTSPPSPLLNTKKTNSVSRLRVYTILKPPLITLENSSLRAHFGLIQPPKAKTSKFCFRLGNIRISDRGAVTVKASLA